MQNKANVLICGGGIIGLTIARELLNKGHDNIVVLDKEKTPNPENADKFLQFIKLAPAQGIHKKYGFVQHF